MHFPVEVPLGNDPRHSRCAIEIRLDPAEGISWRSLENLSFYTRRGERLPNGKWKMEGSLAMCAVRSEPWLPPANCAPENVINGYSRIVDPEHYEWVSDPEQALPQWIELAFAQPAEIDTVSLAFDTDLTNPGTCWTVKRPGVPQCVKDYDVEIFTGGGWSKAAEVSSNFMHRRTHRFEKAVVEKLRVTVRATWGDQSARIAEIRAGLDT